MHFVDDPGQLIDLVGDVELGLVAYQVVESTKALTLFRGHPVEVHVGADFDSRGGHPEGRGDLTTSPVKLAAEHPA